MHSSFCLMYWLNCLKKYNTMKENNPLEKEIPESFADPKNIYEELEKMADETNREMESKNWKKVEACFEQAVTLYRKGDQTMKRLIENIYVFALAIDVNRERSLRCRMLLPEELSKAYYNMYYNDHP